METKLDKEKDKILYILQKVEDPELGGNIVDLGFIDKITELRGKTVIEFHLSNYFVPLILATRIMEDMREALRKIKVDVKLVLTDHHHARELNQYFERIPVA